MSGLVASLTATLLEEAWSRVSRPSSWPDLESGFACLLLRAAHLPLPDAFLAPWRPADPQTFRRAPELAAFSYVLGTSDPRDAALHASWAQGFARLMVREAFPADRQSFAYNPLELLGVALGAASCREIDAQQRAWLNDTIRRALAEARLSGPVAEVSAICAAHALAGTVSPESRPTAIRLPLLSELCTGDLCFVAAQAIIFPDVPDVADLAPWSDQPAVEKEIVRRALSEEISLRGEDAAPVYVCLRRAVDRAVVLSSEHDDATTRVAALCRRFPLFVERLRARQRGRSPFEVRDEYDVQDLLHAILRLHFDDVRPEEWTPSYAGRSSRIDFFLPRERTVVEAKMTRANLGQKEVADELIIDKERYRHFTGAEALVCFVYDPERRCSNPAALETDLAETAPMRVAVVVGPRGT